MNIFIIPDKYRHKERFKDGIILYEKDFDPCSSFFQKHVDIRPESADKISIVGVLENCRYIRCVLKNISWILKVGGELNVDLYCPHFAGFGYALRPEDEIAYEIAMVFGDKIQMIERVNGLPVKRIYKKTASSLSLNDTIDRWTFGIVSNGSRNERILDIIDKIRKFDIPEYEVLICGPTPSEQLPEYIKVIDDTPLYVDKRIPICAKKNAIIRNAKYDNPVIIHDRIMFGDKWYDQMRANGNYWDAIVPAILDENNPRNHMIDNVHYREKPFNSYYFCRRNRKWSPYLYMDGGILIFKKKIAYESMMRDYLNWGEKEDVDFCRRIYANGGYIYRNHQIKVYSYSLRRKSSKTHSVFIDYIKFPLSIMKWCTLWVYEYINFWKYLRR